MSKVLLRPIFRRFFGIRNSQIPNLTLVVEEDVQVQVPKNEIGPIQTIYDICDRKKTFKLWNRVHSTGQGYIKFDPESGVLATSGTSKDAAALQFEQGTHDEEFKIFITSGSKTYYFYCDEDAVMASEDHAKSTNFMIDLTRRASQYNVLRFEDKNRKMKMLTVGADDRLITAVFEDDKMKFERFMGPACSFVIDLN